ncbi:ribose 5-phosphate isomerase A [Scopulibacillus daqui]|uniref:Ribose-5-phosphate isomerase A n=1 Tax=Scopulibacillus daqui TaxID=1469162 RepID=A0ABS2PVB4_9BACL|nr:ribose-5-phosphate isomerase RpiA [Scopulibacillus daqui]MBM7643871.1 ribose 5-phosphate isomerase A [Scopulibacillus daqui]
MDQQTYEKKMVGEKAAEYIKDGMIVGLGTGSTVAFTTKKLADRIKAENLSIQAVSTSHATSKLAESLGISLLDLNDVQKIDLTIDGCDEFDPELNGIKGGGGALLFEKIVAQASDRNIWVADASKAVNQLGAFPLPVEVLRFGWRHMFRAMEEKGLHPKLRMNGEEPFLTDSKNYILDCHAKAIDDAKALAGWLNALPGVVENGLFINICDQVLAADHDKVKVINR